MTRVTALVVVGAILARASATRALGSAAEAVVALARALGEDGALVRALGGGDVCLADEIECECESATVDGGRTCEIVRVKFSGRGLRGRLPETMPSMSSLRVLDLSDNALRGGIPVGFLLAMPRLRELYLNLNTLDGEIPREIGSLSELEVLNLDGGFTSRQRFAEAYVSEKERDVYGAPGTYFGNQFSGMIPEEIGKLTNLRVLNLHRNMLGREGQRFAVPPTIGELQRLEFFDCSGNQLRGELPREIATLPALVQLNMDDNFITGPIPKDWSRAIRLESLVLEGNRLDGELPQFLPRNLTFLDVHENKLTGSINVLSRLKRLEGAILDRNRFSGPVLVSRQTNPNLRTVSLAGNEDLCGETPPLPVATKEDRDEHCDKPWELCQLWPETAGTRLGLGKCECSKVGDSCTLLTNDGRKVRCCEESSCAFIPFGFGAKVCIACSDAFQRCGGGAVYDGPICCQDGLTCSRLSDDDARCLPCAASWSQCDGAYHDGPRCCQSGNRCVRFDDYYSQCQPSA